MMGERRKEEVIYGIERSLEKKPNRQDSEIKNETIKGKTQRYSQVGGGYLLNETNRC
jgi:hypothetical protein